jgi:DNA-binding IclR family transcriptional regulator
MPRIKEDRHFVTALARGLDVLHCFRSSDKVLGNQEIAARCKLPKSTVSRLTYTLTKLGYLLYVEESAKYRLGNATLSLGMAMLARLDVRQLARPLMQQLAELSRATVALGSCDRLAMIYVDVARSTTPLTVSLDLGSRIPVATTAMGRAYLARCPEGERNQIMQQIRERDEAAWPRVRSGIEKSLRNYRELGCTTSFGDWQKEVNSIGVGFNPGGGRLPMAITCGGPAFTLGRDFLLKQARPKLIAIARQLETSLGTAQEPR